MKLPSIFANPLHIWRLFLLFSIFTSCLLVSLCLVFPSLANTYIPLLYGLDIVCWVGLFYTLKNREIESSSNRYPHIILTILTFPWELIFYTSPIVEGALPLIWLLRLFRIVQLNSELYRQEVNSLVNPEALRFLRLLINVTLVSHCIACCWLLIGFVDPEHSWFSHAGIMSLLPNEQYVRSLYWTLTTMTTVGYGDITPVVSREYLFAAFVMLIGASFYAYIIGNVASVIGQLNASKAEFQQRSQFVSRYLFKQNLPKETINRVQNYYSNKWRKYQNFDVDAILSDLPNSLALEIKTFIARDLMDKIPLFSEATEVIREQLLSALQLEFLDPGSVVAREGEKSQKMVFVIEGSLDLRYQNETIETFGAGDYFGNYSLVLNERITASVICTSYCEVMYLHKNNYEKIKSQYPEFEKLMAKAMSEKSEKMSELMLQGVIL